jgi:hypothetical protein
MTFVRRCLVKTIVILPFIPTRLPAFLKTRPIFGHNSKIMVSELKIVFSQNAIALQLRLSRQILIFFKKLRGVSARTIVDPATIILTTIITLRSTAAAPPAVRLTIV